MERIYDQFRQLLIEANIKHKLIQTTHRGHAIEIGKNENLDDFDAAISISGDGLFHEMINGLLTREDGKSVQVGLIPGILKSYTTKILSIISAGSGNGLIHSFLDKSSIKDARSFAMFQMLRFESRPLDLVHFQSEKLSRFCMLSIMAGLVADIG